MKKNKKYSLCLGGGAARGLAHIGVLKYLEENNIVCNEISGTSMGAIVGACYSIGMSYEEIKEFAKNISLIKLIDLNFRKGILNGNKIYKLLQNKFGDAKIEDLDKKLIIVATNINTGKRTIFKKGKIIDALRASISLPSIFTPHKIGDEEYVDGGITCNLPIEVLKGDNIIAASGLKDISGKIKTTKKFLSFNLPKSFFSITHQILQKSIIIMMLQNEYTSINTKGKKVVLIKPDFGKLDYYSFDKVEEMTEVGYREAERVLKK